MTLPSLKGEWAWVAWLSLAVVLITLLPFLFGQLNRPVGSIYTGRHSLSPGDFGNYYQMIEQARQGRFLLSDPFTSEPHRATIFNPYWLLVGQVARLTNWSNAVVFQLARVSAIPLLVVILFWLIRQLVRERGQRLFSLVFMIAASGAGAWSMLWLPHFVDVYANYVRNQPLDLWVSEAVTFLTMLQTGHFIVATALIIVIFILLYRALTHDRWPLVWWAGAAGLFLFFFHPFHLPTVFAVSGIYILVRCVQEGRLLWSWFAKASAFALMTMPAWLYHGLLLVFDPIAAGRAEQNVNLTPPLWIFVLGYGWLLPAALIGIWQLRREKRLQGLHQFLLTWLVVQVILIYGPFAWQRRLTHGWQIPLTFFAAYGVMMLWRRMRRKFAGPLPAGGLVVAGILLFCLSNVYVFANDLSLFTRPQYRLPVYSFYYPQSFQPALKWIRDRVSPGQAILAQYTTSNVIVSETARTVYVGHTVETLKAREKMAAVGRFYDSQTTDQQRLEFIESEKISYVVYGPIERHFSWQDPLFLPVAFQNDDITIYHAP